jgi:hypothetical protein
VPGWERLLTTKDPAERALIRTVLTAATQQHEDRSTELLKRLEVHIQRGVVQAHH